MRPPAEVKEVRDVVSGDTLDVRFLHRGPRGGWPTSGPYYFECRTCRTGFRAEELPRDFPSCRCGAMKADSSMSRFGHDDGDREIDVWEILGPAA